MKLQFLMGLALCGTLALQAQNKHEGIIINNNEIFRDYQVNVPALAKGHPELGVHTLINKVNEHFPASLLPALKKVKPNTVPLSPEDIYEKCSDAVLVFGNYFDCGECDKMHVGADAGAVVLTPDGICMTNYHVFADLIQKDWQSIGGDSIYYVGNRKGKVYPVTNILGYSKDADMALFKIDTKGEQLPCLPIGGPLRTGAEVNLISHPRQFFYYFSKGYVGRNSVYDPARPELDRMQITADYAVGSSGCPILDKYGNIVSMVVSTNNLYVDMQKKQDSQMVLRSTVPAKIMKLVLGWK